MVDRVLSKSYVAILPQEEQDKLAGQIRTLFDRPDEELGRTWLSPSEGVFEYPYRTDLFLYYRK